MNTEQYRAGYQIKRIFVTEQSYELAEPETGNGGEAAEARSVRFGWDWRPLGTRQFEVAIQIGIEPTQSAPERLRVRLVGVFTAGEDATSITFAKFVRTNAPAILFAYAREVISTMTGRGPHGAFHIDPVNIEQLMSAFAMEKTSGAQFLDKNPEEARDFGLEYSVKE